MKENDSPEEVCVRSSEDNLYVTLKMPALTLKRLKKAQGKRLAYDIAFGRKFVKFLKEKYATTT